MNLPPEIINDFELRVRRAVDGVLTGRFRSRSFGGSPEFAEYRPYNPGDDVRRIDWRVYARRRKLFLKVFFHESEIPLTLLYDNTPSMNFWGKREMGARFVGAFSYMAYRGNNAFSFYGISGGHLPMGRGYEKVLIAYSMALSTNGKAASLFKTTLGVLGSVKKRSLVAVVSDFAFPLEEIDTSFHLLSLYHEVVAVHVLSPREWNFSDDGKVLVDSETGERLSVPPNSAHVQRQRIRWWVAGVRRSIVSQGGRYVLVLSDEDFPLALRRSVEELFYR
ncbi:MAG: DUF58 domain-containing protein [Thermotogae bacterium]|nr:DUF58 domain-containing protein [Thermotogota bacterium]